MRGRVAGVPARIAAPTPASIAEAARCLRSGGLVAMPTETVYGLAANALDADAVARIFSAKGRPASNPLIVHVANREAARALARRWPDAAEALAKRHWPGPLTLVVERGDTIPDIVTAGGPTVGLRVPDHPVALELLRAAEIPLAAPSANRSEAISPTTAQHVADSLGPFVEDLLVLDGGPCRVGLESTVVDVTGERAVVLRPGMVRIDEADASARPTGPERSPGRHPRHYAPTKPITVVAADALARTLSAGDGLLRLPDEAATAAALLYAELRRLDADPSVLRIVVVAPPEGREWDALRDRLRRASA